MYQNTEHACFLEPLFSQCDNPNATFTTSTSSSSSPPSATPAGEGAQDRSFEQQLKENAALENTQQFVEKKKVEILEKRNKDLELLKMDSLEGIIRKALAQKDR